MPQINNTDLYPNDDSINENDRLIGSDYTDSNKTKNFKLGDIITYIISIVGSGNGDMVKGVYDTNDNGKVDTAENAETVNSLTVQTAVPIGAIFTDTVYDDTAIQAEVDANTAKTGITAQQATDITTNNAKNTYPSADASKLAGIEASAKDDQTGAEIKALYEAEANTNAFTDAEKTLLGNQSGTNTGDQVIPVSGVDFDPVGTDNSDDNAVNSLYSGLEASKQDTLVSATNIKTVNGTTLLGSGDLTVSAGDIEGTAVKSTDETGGSKFLREDGDGTCSWQSIGGGGDMLAANNLSDLASAATSRTNLGVDVAGTDNSTDVTLAGTGTYLSLVGQAITVDPITESDISDLGTYSTDIHANITALNNVSGTNTGDQTSIVGITGTKAQFDTAVTDGNIMYIGDAPTAHNQNADTIDIADAGTLITATDVEGALQENRTAINLNTAKNTYPSGDATKVGYLTVTQAVDLDTIESNVATNNAKVGVTTQISNIVEDTTPQLGGNLDLNGNVITGLQIGTDVQAYSTVLQNTTASFLTADETKLDGIEAGADVTDTTNVTSAGALMDSEVTNLAQVKAFNSADYATSAQGTLADSALQSADIANFETTTELNARDTNNRARVNHTGTQLASTISDFDAEVSNNADVTANTAKVTNATHTGDVTGDTVLTIANGAVDIAMLSATGTASTSTYLRGDNTWATVSGSGDLLASNNLSDVASATTSRTNLGLAIGTDVQAYSSVLQNTTASFLTADETKLDGIEAGAEVNDTVCIAFAISDETTDLTTGTAKATFRMPFALTLTDVRASVTTAPTGSEIQIDIKESGTSIFTAATPADLLSIDASAKTSVGATNPYVLVDTALADDAEITFDIDQVGSTAAGAGLKIYLIGNR